LKVANSCVVCAYQAVLAEVFKRIVQYKMVTSMGTQQGEAMSSGRHHMGSSHLDMDM
jgi:hypothetical protein